MIVFSSSGESAPPTFLTLIPGQKTHNATATTKRAHIITRVCLSGSYDECGTENVFLPNPTAPDRNYWSSVPAVAGALNDYPCGGTGAMLQWLSLPTVPLSCKNLQANRKHNNSYIPGTTPTKIESTHFLSALPSPVLVAVTCVLVAARISCAHACVRAGPVCAARTRGGHFLPDRQRGTRRSCFTRCPFCEYLLR